MDKSLLDTDVLIHFFKEKFGFLEKIDQVGIENCYVSEISLAELFYGAHYSDNLEKHLKEGKLARDEFQILPTSKIIERYGKERARLRKAGAPIDRHDIFIGTTAVTYGLTMVTGNAKHFERLKGIQLQDWTKTEHNEFAA
jgi:tRNA(fMet)-specific endonuclease VapC